LLDQQTRLLTIMNNRIKFALMGALSIAASIAPTVSFAQQAMITQNCEDLNYDIKREGSPYHYKNPNASCGISLKLDGLPSVSGGQYSNNGNDACSQIRGINKDLQGKLNGKLQSALGAIGDVVSADDLDRIAGSAGIDASTLTGVMRDGIDQDLIGGDLASLGVAVGTEEGRKQTVDKIKDETIDFTKETFEEMRDPQNNTPSGINPGGAASPGVNPNGQQEQWSIF